MSADDNKQDAQLVLVTGASGFIGSHCVLQLLEAGFKVRGTVRNAKDAKHEWLKEMCPEAKENLELVSANLTSTDGWEEAVSGCVYVLHVASPFPAEAPKHEDELIKPAVHGTQCVLKAVAKLGGVKRVVLTSSVVSVDAGIDEKDRPRAPDESLWSNVDKAEPYPKSKTLAERAAWEIWEAAPVDKKFELATINPAYVVGPALHRSVTGATSFTLTKRLMTNDMPGIPKISMGVVDVRDVALAHVRAMTQELPPLDPEKPFSGKGVGHRFIVYSDMRWFSEVAELLKDKFGKYGYKVPTMSVPYPVLWIVSLWDKAASNILSSVGKEIRYNNARARDILKIDFRSPSDSFVASAQSLIDLGVIENKLDAKK